ncbi:MAG: Rpp14/Pop5 family protein [archaeon]
MVKLKPLLPTLKEKKRYVVYEVLCEEDLKEDLSKEIVKKVTSILGVFDSAKAGVQSIEYDNKQHKGVLRVAVKQVDKLKMSLALINALNDKELTIRTIGASGILKKARSKYMAS